MKNIFPLITLALLTGCNLTPEYQHPVTELPAEWSKNQQGSELTAEWWKKYDNAELNTLIAKALSNNKDLAAGLARIEQARASSKIAGAGLLPTVDGGASASKTYDDNSTRNRDSYSADIKASYEVDLFGRNRASSNAAEMREKATIYDYDALALITASDTATFYAQYLSLNDRIKIAENNLSNGNDILRIVQARYDEGKISALDLSQQKASLSTLESAIANLKSQRDISRSQIAILTGVTPQSLQLTGTSIADLDSPSVKPIQPGELLERRPDIKAYEADLIAANIDIGAAKAEFFPKLQISASPGLAASSFSDPASFATTLLASLAQPIFSGGALEGNLEQTKARKEELAAGYSNLVLTSLKEVEDALSSINAANESLRANNIAKTESQKAYDIARIRYDEGRSDFQTVLDTQRSLFQSEDSYYQSSLNEITASVDLYKSLGGGWKEPE